MSLVSILFLCMSPINEFIVIYCETCISSCPWVFINCRAKWYLESKKSSKLYDCWHISNTDETKHSYDQFYFPSRNNWCLGPIQRRISAWTYQVCLNFTEMAALSSAFFYTDFALMIHLMKQSDSIIYNCTHRNWIQTMGIVSRMFLL